MKKHRLIDLIEAYGSDPTRFPASEKADARAALAGPLGADVAEALARSQALDAELSALPEVAISPGLTAALLNDFPPQKKDVSLWRQFARRALVPSGAAFASLSLGVFAGLASAPAMADDGFLETVDQLVSYEVLDYSNLLGDEV